MKKICRPFFLATFLVVLALAAPVDANPNKAATATTDEYTISVIPFYGPEKIWALYTPFVEFLRESTGRPWSLKLFPNHESLIAGLCEGKTAFAMLGPVPLGRVIDRCRAEPLLVALGKDGTPYYRSVIVSTDPSITTLAELKGKRFGFFKGSTAAHILPRKVLRQAGLGKDDIVPVFFEGQDHIINALLRRRIAAAGLKEALYLKFQGEPLRVLAYSTPVPNFAFAVAPGTSAATRKLLVDALLKLAPGENDSDRKRMAAWDDEVRNGFILPDSSFRSMVKEMLIATEEVMREDR
ncbi:MAG: PhnD/SsuA/transferrin family substrate-binding protein [Desulfurivibrionaceae bacterium]